MSIPEDLFTRFLSRHTPVRRPWYLLHAWKMLGPRLFFVQTSPTWLKPFGYIVGHTACEFGYQYFQELVIAYNIITHLWANGLCFHSILKSILLVKDLFIYLLVLVKHIYLLSFAHSFTVVAMFSYLNILFYSYFIRRCYNTRRREWYNSLHVRL